MTVALAKYGVAIFGPVLKFILTDYLACIIMSTVGYRHFPYRDWKGKSDEVLAQSV